MKVEKKKFFIILTIFMVCILFTNLVQASTFDPDYYEPKSTTNVINASQLETLGNKIIGVVQVIGSAISVIALVIIGIKYVLGSVEEKAEYKQTLKPYLIGAVLLFGITNLLAIIQNIVLNL